MKLDTKHIKLDTRHKKAGVFTSHDLDESRFHLSKLFKPHDLTVSGKGQALDVCVEHIRLSGLSFVNLRHGASVEIYPGKLDDFFLLQIPVTGTGTVRIGSTKIDCSSEVAYMISPTFDVKMNFFKHCDHIILRIEKTNLEGFLERQLQRALTVPLEFKPIIHVNDQGNQELINMITSLGQQLSFPNSPLRHAMLRDQVISLLMSTVLVSLQHNYHDELTRNTSTPLPFYIKKAQDYIHANALMSITPEDIAEVSCISLRSVYAGFRTYLDTTPMAYLKDVRLTLVHAELKEKQGYETSVTQLAMKYGFSHFGNFAASYREKFGELPSETLKKTFYFS